jgi:CheY-like chemotaxis protein
MKPSVQRDTAVLLVMVALGMLVTTVASYRESQAVSGLFLVMAVLEFVLLGLVYVVVAAHFRQRRRTITLSPPPVPVIVPARRTRPLILVVDDEIPAQELLRTSLLPDYQVATASSATQAVQLARELKPDLLTLDILMPAGSGWAVLAQLKSDVATATIPVIIVSNVDRKELGFLLGASEYLVKPVTREQLLESVRRHVAPYAERKNVPNGQAHAGRLEETYFPGALKFTTTSLSTSMGSPLSRKGS